MRLGLSAHSSGVPGGAGLNLQDALGTEQSETAARATSGTHPGAPGASPTPAPGIHQRVAAIREAAAEGLDAKEIQAAYTFIAESSEELSGENYHWMADEVLIALRNQEQLPADIETRLAAIATDPGQDLVIRDYALQHLGHLHQEGGGDSAIIEATLWQAASNPQGDLAGTALIALATAASDGRLPNPAELPKIAKTLATDPTYSVATRSTALSLLGEHGGEEALPTLQAVSQDTSAPTLLRLGALSALAQTAAGLPLLESHLHNPDDRLREAAQTLLGAHTISTN